MAVAGQVPGEHVEVVGQVVRAVGPQGAGDWCRGTVRGPAAAAPRGGAAPVSRTPVTTGVMRALLAARAQTRASIDRRRRRRGSRPRACGPASVRHRALLGTYGVARGLEGGGHPVRRRPRRPAEQLGGLAGGHDGPAQQGPQGVPLGVPGPVGAFVDRRRRQRRGGSRRGPGLLSAVRRTSAESTGFALCGIVDDAPPAPSASSPISGRLRVRTSVAMRPQASVQPVAASPSRVTVDRVVCHGVEAVRPERGGQLERQRGGRADRVVEVARELDGRGQGAGGAAHLHREDERRRWRRTRRGRRSASPPPSGRTSWARRAG